MCRTPRRLAISVAIAWSWAWLPPGAFARPADEPTVDHAVIAASVTPRREPVRPDPRRQTGPSSRGDAGAGWWIGPVGIAAAFAAVGAVSLAAKRFNLNLNLGMAREGGSIGVIGQARLSPRHSVHLVRVGGRVLIVGTGPAGSPTTLGEVTDPVELDRLVPRRPATGRSSAAPSAIKLGPGVGRVAGFDQRIGDDE